MYRTTYMPLHFANPITVCWRPKILMAHLLFDARADISDIFLHIHGLENKRSFHDQQVYSTLVYWDKGLIRGSAVQRPWA